MTRTEIASLYQSPASFSGKKVTVCGWVRTIRDSKALGFMELNDGSCFKDLQVVMDRPAPAHPGHQGPTPIWVKPAPPKPETIIRKCFWETGSKTT